MVNRWRAGKMYTYVGPHTDDNRIPMIYVWRHYQIGLDISTVTLIEPMRSYPKSSHESGLPVGNFAKVLLGSGEVLYMEMHRNCWTEMSKNWMRKQRKAAQEK